MKTFIGGIWRGALLWSISALLSVTAAAQLTYTLSTSDRGWYDNNGDHEAANDNYIAGILDATQHRNFFVFDRSAVAGSVISAELRLYLPFGGYNSPSATENYYIYQINSTSISTLVAGGTGLASVYSDLGGGSSFGSATIGVSGEDSFINITLNATFLTYINSLSGEFGVGGRVTTLSGSLDQNVFAFSGTGDAADGKTQLILMTDAPAATPVPEPSACGLMGVGMLAAVIAWSRRRKTG